MPALGDSGFAVYRRAVVKAREAAVASAVHDWELYTVDRLYFEILDAEGDVDAVVEFLSRGETPKFAGIIRRLDAAGRHGEAMEYLERAISAERIVAPSTVYVGDVENESFLTPGGVVELLLADGRCGDARDFCWWVFQKWPQKHTYRLCLDVADKCGSLAADRQRLLEFIDQHPWYDGSIPIAIALSDDDLERAWAAARRWGAGSYWDTLVGLVPQPYPLDALDVYFERMQLVLAKTGRKSSRECVGLLKRAFSLARFSDASASAEQGEPITAHGERFAEILSGLRNTYGNRPTLMEEMRRAGFIS